MKNHFINYYSSILILLGASLGIPLITALAYGELTAAGAFAVTMLICILPGMSVRTIFRPHIDDTPMKHRESYLFVATTWLLASVIGSLPYLFTGVADSFVDAFFETASGFTTTGSTILTDIESLPRSVLLWRSFTQWLGGMGIVVLFVALLPGIGVKARNIAKAETPGPTVTRLTYHYTGTAQMLYLLYILLTGILMLLLLLGNMSFYDALNHALTTMATGGFSTYNDSIAHFNSPYITWVLTVFMLIAGTNFELFFMMLRGDTGKILRNEELRTYCAIVIFAVAGITASLLLQGDYSSFGSALTDSAFHVSTVISTTGYATRDFSLWPSFCQMLLLLLMFSGACSSSTAGGLKIVRIVALFKMILHEVKVKLHGKIIRDVKMDGVRMPSEMVTYMIGFFSMYILTLLIGTGLLTLTGDADLLTDFTAALTCISNVGPGLKDVGPVCNFAFYSDFSKMLLSMIMIAGRLELSTFFIIFSRFFWQPHKV